MLKKFSILILSSNPSSLTFLAGIFLSFSISAVTGVLYKSELPENYGVLYFSGAINFCICLFLYALSFMVERFGNGVIDLMQAGGSKGFSEGEVIKKYNYYPLIIFALIAFLLIALIFSKNLFGLTHELFHLFVVKEC